MKLPKFIVMAVLLVSAGCASIEGIERHGNPIDFRSGTTCLVFIQDNSNVGMALAKELQMHFRNGGLQAETRAKGDLPSEPPCPQTVTLEHSIWWGNSLGHVYVSFYGESGKSKGSFKFENSDRNCCHKGPAGAASKIYEQLTEQFGNSTAR